MKAQLIWTKTPRFCAAASLTQSTSKLHTLKFGCLTPLRRRCTRGYWRPLSKERHLLFDSFSPSQAVCINFPAAYENEHAATCNLLVMVIHHTHCFFTFTSYFFSWWRLFRNAAVRRNCSGKNLDITFNARKLLQYSQFFFNVCVVYFSNLLEHFWMCPYCTCSISRVFEMQARAFHECPECLSSFPPSSCQSHRTSASNTV